MNTGDAGGSNVYHSERSPLLRDEEGDEAQMYREAEAAQNNRNRRQGVAIVLTLLFILGLVIVFAWSPDQLSSDPVLAARQILDKAPVIVSGAVLAS